MNERLLSVRDGYGNTPIIAAAEEGNSAMVEYLLLQQTDPAHAAITTTSNIGLEGVNKQGWSALHYAAKSDHSHILDLLLEKGCNLYAKTNKGRTALDLALRYKNESCVSCLLLHGCPFPLYILGRHGAAAVEMERNMVVATCGSTHYEDCRQGMQHLWSHRILPGL